MFELKLWLAALVPVFGLAVATWAVSVARRDVSIVDRIWSLMILAAGGTYALAGQPTSERALAVLTLLALWALRLAAHITVRGWGEPEDRRYRAIRARNEPGFAWKSLYLLFGLQALLAWVISLPLLAVLNTTRPLGWLEAIGAALWLTGFAIESVADWQLVRFRSLPINRGRVLDTGLWRYSRHPNYFGEFLVWWGFFVMALPAGGWWSFVSPILMTLLLLRVSGVALLEQDIAERRPAYRDYARNTNAFFPAPPRAGSAAAVREARR
jgi:steroid 5-alpha reductase family enzyme